MGTEKIREKKQTMVFGFSRKWKINMWSNPKQVVNFKDQEPVMKMKKTEESKKPNWTQLRIRLEKFRLEQFITRLITYTLVSDFVLLNFVWVFSSVFITHYPLDYYSFVYVVPKLMILIYKIQLMTITFINDVYCHNGLYFHTI